MLNTADSAGSPSVPAVAAGKVKTWPIKISISGAVVLGMILVSLMIMALGWSGARTALLATASRTAADAGDLINERARRLLEPAQSTLRQMSFDPIMDARALPDRLERLHVMTEVLAVNPLVAAIYIGYSDGQFMLVRPLDSEVMRERFNAPVRSTYVVQSRGAMADGDILGEYLFYDAMNVLVERRRMDDYTFDPRFRPWYNKASGSATPVLAEPYVFFTTKQAGLTLSQVNRSNIAVVGIDMVLDDISSSLNSMRITPRAEMALVNDQMQVLAYPDMSKVLFEVDNRIDFKKVKEVGEPSLIALAEANPPFQEPRFFDVGGEELLGIVLPFNVWEGQRMRLMITVPVNDMLGDLIAKRRYLVMLVIGLVCLMLPMGWVLGGRIARSLDHLTDNAKRIGRFDFGGEPIKPTFVKEVNQLGDVMGGMSHTIQSFLQLSQVMAVEPEVDKMLSKVLHELVEATRCTGAAVYLWNKDAQRMDLAAVVGDDVGMFSQGLGYPDGQPRPAGTRALTTGGMQLELELRGRTGQLQGMLALVHPAGSSHADPSFVEFARRLSGSLAVSIETRQLIEAQKNLLDGVIRLMADAIDAKSPYTGGHCERVPELATMLVDRMNADRDGLYSDFKMTADERYEFYLGAWLHDCGKVTSPEYIVDKATKLEVICNRIHEVRTRFEVLWRDAEIEHLQRLVDGTPQADSVTQRDARQQQLRDDFAFIAQCNVGGEFMSDESIARLRTIAAQTWQRYFDDTLGVASEELRRIQNARPESPALPATEVLLADRPDHVVPWDGKKPPVEKGDPDNIYGFDMKLPATKQNMGEVYNLAIRRGTLTDEDRFKINDHVVQTYIMLKALPWPDQLKRVPDIAATHHEKMDGKGYPRQLPGSQLTVFDKVMALADIFEALTAADRPYKAPKTLTESLRIMAFMCKDQHIDTELFRYFLHSGLWKEFAGRYMNPSQVDTVDIAAIEKLLPNPNANANANAAVKA